MVSGEEGRIHDVGVGVLHSPRGEGHIHNVYVDVLQDRGLRGEGRIHDVDAEVDVLQDHRLRGEEIHRGGREVSRLRLGSLEVGMPT